MYTVATRGRLSKRSRLLEVGTQIVGAVAVRLGTELPNANALDQLDPLVQPVIRSPHSQRPSSKTASSSPLIEFLLFSPLYQQGSISRVLKRPWNVLDMSRLRVLVTSPPRVQTQDSQ